jgi:hypothetical protein
VQAQDRAGEEHQGHEHEADSLGGAEPIELGTQLLPGAAQRLGAQVFFTPASEIAKPAPEASLQSTALAVALQLNGPSASE